MWNILKIILRDGEWRTIAVVYKYLIYGKDIGETKSFGDVQDKVGIPTQLVTSCVMLSSLC